MAKSTPLSTALIPVERIESRILSLRGQRVILSSELAVLYGVPVRVLNQAVSRNLERFPHDFMFQLTPAEFKILKSQFVISNQPSAGPFLRSQSVTLKPDMRGKHLKYPPYAFTEQGVAMLSAVLRSPTAVAVSIEIVRAFARLRRLLASHKDLRRKLETLEARLAEHDERFTLVFDAIRDLINDPDDPPKPPVGFQTELAEPKRQNRLRSSR
jgi:hypothetical protein